jgi:hypothetical protein
MSDFSRSYHSPLTLNFSAGDRAVRARRPYFNVCAGRPKVSDSVGDLTPFYIWKMGRRARAFLVDVLSGISFNRAAEIHENSVGSRAADALRTVNR